MILLTGCMAPMGAQRTTARQAYKQVTASALDHKLSDSSRLVLHRYRLQNEFEKNPEHVLLYLQEKVRTDERRDLLYALAELNYIHGVTLSRCVKPGGTRNAPDLFFASALYAWGFLLSEGTEAAPDGFDRRFRTGCDLYNRALARAFMPPGTNTAIQLSDSPRHLGALTVNVRLGKTTVDWNAEEVEELLPADEFVLRGFSVRDRRSGIGAPLIVSQKATNNYHLARRYPATLVLRAPIAREVWCGTNMTVDVELHSSFAVQSIEVGDRRIPLEADTTAPLAHAMNENWVWKLGSEQFFSGEPKVPSRIYPTQPYEPGKIPVIFVHGTFSSPIWWAEMWNTLRADSRLRERFQFWNFIYNSGSLITQSAATLRDEIEKTIHRLDPEGKDPALREIVIVGHSQGGLLAKLTAVDTGDRLWRVGFKKDFSECEFKDEEERSALKRVLFFEPLPEVKRLVFICTPHRGSYLSTAFVRTLARRFMNFQQEAVRLTETALRVMGQETDSAKIRRIVPTSLDGMSPRNKVLQALAEIPLAPGVASHSIIAVKGNGPEEGGGDGVVKYRSAKLDGVESTFVVHSGHSCQDRPEVIEEVRRILIEHLAASNCPENAIQAIPSR
jgi:pimeloyl-ACP methyl ester carboxylesterase